MRHAYFFERLLNPLLALAGGHTAVGERQLHILVNGEIADQIEGLKDETDLAVADARPFTEGEIRHWLAV